MRPIAVAPVLLLLLSEPNGDALARCRDQKPVSWDIEIAPPGEPGERLVVTGRVLSKEDIKPVAGATVYVYHADIRGRYNQVGNETFEPKLCGVLLTNQKGEYRIRTVMPGGYSGARPHIHFEVWGRNVARQQLFVNLYLKGVVPTFVPNASAAPPLISGRVPDNPASMNRPVRRGEDGLLHCTHNLVVDAAGSLPLLPLPRKK